jgi:hypothetical protein
VWVQVSPNFGVFVWGKVWVVETWFLLGVFAFYCVLVMVICGESVVSCVANVVNHQTLCGA